MPSKEDTPKCKGLEGLARCKMYSNTQTRSMWRKLSLDKSKEEITRKENKGPRKDANGTQKKINGSKDKQIELNGS